MKTFVFSNLTHVVAPVVLKAIFGNGGYMQFNLDRIASLGFDISFREMFYDGFYLPDIAVFMIHHFKQATNVPPQSTFCSKAMSSIAPPNQQPVASSMASKANDCS